MRPGLEEPLHNVEDELAAPFEVAAALTGQRPRAGEDGDKDRIARGSRHQAGGRLDGGVQLLRGTLAGDRDGVGAERLVEARQALGQLGRVGEELVEGQGLDLRRLGDDQRGEEARLGPPAPEEQTGPGPGGCGHRDQRSPTAA